MNYLVSFSNSFLYLKDLPLISFYSQEPSPCLFSISRGCPFYLSILTDFPCLFSISASFPFSRGFPELSILKKFSIITYTCPIIVSKIPSHSLASVYLLRSSCPLGLYATFLRIVLLLDAFSSFTLASRNMETFYLNKLFTICSSFDLLHLLTLYIQCTLYLLFQQNNRIRKWHHTQQLVPVWGGGQ